MREPLTAESRLCVPSTFPHPAEGGWSTKTIFLLAMCCIFCASGYAQNPICRAVPAGQEFWIRLTEPVSTYSSKRGAAVKAIVVESPRCQEAPVFSTRTAVQGRITHVRRVGMGFWHGSSAVTIAFDQIVANSKSLAVKARVVEVANGREGVKRGVIEGVDGETPQELMSTRLLHLPFWNPESYWIFLVRRGAFPFSPEPEIYLPAGTDIRMRLMAPLELPAEFVSAREDENRQKVRDDLELNDDVRERLLALPGRSVTRKGRPSDIVNLAFIGSPQQIEGAFEAAGWTYGDSVSTWSVLREMRAVSALSSYSHLPISNQWLDGEAPEIRLQKSFDSYQKREHIRFWDEDGREQNLWAGGAIRETSAAWSIRTGRFIHHVDADVDAEREKIVRDLTLTGCVANVYRLERPEKAQQEKNASGDVLRTDGGLAVIELNDCESPATAAPPSTTVMAWRPKSRLSRFVRAQALSIHDLWRSNAIYASYDLSRMVIQSLQSLRSRRSGEYETRKNTGLSSERKLGY
jgi:LssY C-terminus